MKPQAFGTLRETRDISVRVMGEDIHIRREVATCALGAALDAMGKLSGA